MPRVPRCRREPGSLEPGQLYHVTNRGVDRSDVFHRDLDRIVFLSLLAEACVRWGVVCHAFCLMTSHFHLVVEDTRGVLSQMMHSLEFCYARYFNDTRRRRRTGPLFENRFDAQLIDTSSYFHDAVAYVLLNPVVTATPMAPTAESYRWSSAATVCGDVTSAEFCRSLVAPFGGIDGVLEALPPTRFVRSRERRRERLEALESGGWLERERVLSGRLPEHYRMMLGAKAAAKRQAKDDGDDRVLRSVPVSAVMTVRDAAIVMARRPFAGVGISEVVGRVERVCERFVPGALAGSAEKLKDVVAYALWRFTSASADAVARAVKMTEDNLDRVLRRLQVGRIEEPALERLLWSIEWALRWRLMAAPHRP